LAELKDVDVERVDAVDRPATRRKWLILKSEEEDEEMVNLDELQKAALAAIEALAKDAGNEGLEISEAAVEALNTLAKLLGANTQFKAKAKPDKDKEGESDQGYGYGEGYPEPKKPAKKDDAVLKALEEHGKLLAEIRDALKPVAKSALASKQPEGDEVKKSAPRKWGEGLFVDVVFGPQG